MQEQEEEEGEEKDAWMLELGGSWNDDCEEQVGKKDKKENCASASYMDLEARTRPHNTKRRGKRWDQDRLRKDAEIAIVGAGLGGLSAALSLQSAGFTSITLYEKRASSATTREEIAVGGGEGYGLTLSYNPQGPLARLGVLETIAQHDCPSRSHYVFRPNGSIMGYFGNAFFDAQDHRGLGQRGNLRVPREVVRQVLLEKLASPSNGGGGKESVPRVCDKKRCIGFTERQQKAATRSEEEEEEKPLVLHFDDGSCAQADFLVGADGLRSCIVDSLLQQCSPNGQQKQQDGAVEEEDLKYLGIMIIVGITDGQFFHSLLDERGFYTLDGTHRLFIMPYEGSHLEDCVAHLQEKKSCDAAQCTPICARRRYMWQLSYRLDQEEEARRLRQSGPEALREEVLRRCASWHEPVTAMVESTPLSTIWGTGLMERNPEKVLQKIQSRRNPSDGSKVCFPVVILGDAVHAMSPFKGQGANQALADGPLLASWLDRAAIGPAIRGFHRDMVLRTAPKVRASSQAAAFLHSMDAIKDGNNQSCCSFAGVNEAQRLLTELEERQIGAQTPHLDHCVREVLLQGKYSQTLTSLALPEQQEAASRQYQRQALEWALLGDLAALREFSVSHSKEIRLAVDENGQTCLHRAIRARSFETCKFLLSEIQIPMDHCYKHGRTVMDLVVSTDVSKESADSRIWLLLQAATLSRWTRRL